MKESSIKVIAFDCFDTIFHRKCHPEVILYSWARSMAAALDFSVKADQIYDKRKVIEKYLRSQKKIEEIKYEELIGELYKIFESKCNKLTKTEFIELSYCTECALEKKELYINQDILYKVKKYKSENFQIVIISDFYMGNRFFEEILSEFKIEMFFDKVYISSEFGVRKSSGNLYNIVLKDLQIDANEMLMIGDNNLSDQEIPQKLGIQISPIYYRSDLSCVNKKQIIQFQKNNFKSDGKNVFSGFMPPVMLFLEKIFKLAKSNHCKKLLFCSREGQVLKSLFDKYQQTLFPLDCIDTEYFYVSRRATLLPSLKNLDVENFERIFRQYKSITLFDFLYSIGFEKKEIIDFCKNNTFDNKQLIEGNSELLRQIKRNKDFILLYNKKRIEQRNLLVEYIHSVTPCDEDNIWIVDIGWKGTIQDNIFYALGGKKKIIGLYLGIVAETVQCANNVKYGLLFDEKKRENEWYLFNYIEFEKVFVADHGQVLGYKKTNSIVLPVCSQEPKDIEIYEYVKMWLQNLEKVFSDSLMYYCNSKYTPLDFESQLKQLYLRHLCITEPKQFEIYINFRGKSKENFGNISRIKSTDKNYTRKAKKLRRKYCYVDCVYRIFDRLNLNRIVFCASFYCRIVYFIMKLKFNI